MHPFYISVRAKEIKIPEWLCAHCSLIKLEMMKDSITKYGLVNYPICYKDDQGIHLIDGFARLKTYSEDEYIGIQCYNMTETEAMKFFIDLNSSLRK